MKEKEQEQETEKEQEKEKEKDSSEFKQHSVKSEKSMHMPMSTSEEELSNIKSKNDDNTFCINRSNLIPVPQSSWKRDLYSINKR